MLLQIKLGIRRTKAPNDGVALATPEGDPNPNLILTLTLTLTLILTLILALTLTLTLTDRGYNLSNVTQP